MPQRGIVDTQNITRCGMTVKEILPQSGKIYSNHSIVDIYQPIPEAKPHIKRCDSRMGHLLNREDAKVAKEMQKLIK